MNGSWLLAWAAAIALPALAGCDGASSARETLRDASASGRQPAQVTADQAAAGDVPANSNATAALPSADASGFIEATFDDVKFEMEKTEAFQRSMLTPKAQSLFGKRIRIRGYMYPTLRRKGLTQFVLVRDNLECCFGPGAALYDCIVVTMAPGKTAEYSIRPIAVEGTFRLEELPGPDGRPLAIYQMVGEAVK